MSAVNETSQTTAHKETKVQMMNRIPIALQKLCDENPMFNYEKLVEFFVREGLCKDETKGKKQKKDPLAPKRPKTAFMFYSQHIRKDVTAYLGQEATIGNVSKEIARRWNKLTDDVKAEFIEHAQEDKQRYEKEMKEYKETKETK